MIQDHFEEGSYNHFQDKDITITLMMIVNWLHNDSRSLWWYWKELDMLRRRSGSVHLVWLLFLQKKDYYILKILLRFGDDLIKSMKEGFSPTESNHLSSTDQFWTLPDHDHLSNNKNFLFINNIRLIHFLLEDFHYEPQNDYHYSFHPVRSGCR